MKRYTKVFVASVLALTFASVGTLAHALTFQKQIGVSFTFDPSLSVTLSADLVIPSLTPGTVSDSNVININVKSNNMTGYTLNANVGNNTTFNTRDMIHKDTSIANKFTSVDFGSSITNKTDLEDNTWAYSYLDETLNNGANTTNTTWEPYSGLPLYSDDTNVATIKATTTPATSESGDNIKFKIAAKASSDQASGEYNNVINFTAVAMPVPDYNAYLYTGEAINTKMKNLANNITDASTNTQDTKITTIAQADSLPIGFTPSTANTITRSTSAQPVYIFFDDTTGTMYYYTEADDIVLNPNSSIMFVNLTSLTNINDLAYWNTSSVTTMAGMFRGASSLTNIDSLADWNTSSVTNMSNMFYYARSLTNIDDASDWDTSSVTTMAGMFANASSLTNIDGVSGWDTSSVTNMAGMFAGASSLTNIDALENWNTSNVTDMSNMFAGASSLTNINGASNWNTGNVTDIGVMFNGVNNIDATVLNNWNVSKITNKTAAFTCPYNKRPSWY